MTTQELQPPGQATKLSFKDQAGTSLPMAADMTGRSLCAHGGSTVSRAPIPVRLWGPGADTPTGVFFRDYQTRTWGHGEGGAGAPTHPVRAKHATGSDCVT